MGLSLSLVLALSVGAPLSFATPTKAELERGIQLFESFKDAEAAIVFRRVLSREAPGAIAAKARLYLGLIAFNAIDPDEARVEFRRALELNPAAELPSQASPKARLAYAEVRRDMTRELAAVPPPPTPAESPATADLITPDFHSPLPPAPAVAIGPEVSQPAPAASHVAAYAILAATVVLTGLAIYGGVEVATYNSMVASGNAAVGNASVPYSASQLSSARGPASFWAVGWPVAAALGAVGVAGAVLTW